MDTIGHCSACDEVRHADDLARKTRQVGRVPRTLFRAGAGANARGGAGAGGPIPMKARLEQRVADALAAAFLANGEWTRRALIARGAITLGTEARWLSELVETALARFPAPPRARFHFLARFIASRPLLTRRERRDPLSVVRTLVAQLDMAVTRWGVPPLATTGDLARWLDLSSSESEWFADGRGLERLDRDERLRHYHYRWVPKRHGGFRLLEAPKPRTKALQRRILDEISSRVPAHDAAHGFRRGRSALTHALHHVGRASVIRIDLRDFFLSISAARVAAIFRATGYPEDVAWTLALLCTNVSPPSRGSVVLDRHASHSEVSALRHAEMLARTRHLPQGAPTSPALANLCAYQLDIRLTALARNLGASYTRYADDLVFSGDVSLARCAVKFETTVASIVTDEGFAVNHRKTRVMRAGTRQRVTGIVVNDRPNPTREDYERLEATLHNCALRGPAGENRAALPDFRAHLMGRISHMTHLNADRGRRLRHTFDRIVWPPSAAE